MIFALLCSPLSMPHAAPAWVSISERSPVAVPLWQSRVPFFSSGSAGFYRRLSSPLVFLVWLSYFQSFFLIFCIFICIAVVFLWCILSLTICFSTLEFLLLRQLTIQKVASVSDPSLSLPDHILESFAFFRTVFARINDLMPCFVLILAGLCFIQSELFKCSFRCWKAGQSFTLTVPLHALFAKFWPAGSNLLLQKSTIGAHQHDLEVPVPKRIEHKGWTGEAVSIEGHDPWWGPKQAEETPLVVYFPTWRGERWSHMWSVGSGHTCRWWKVVIHSWCDVYLLCGISRDMLRLWVPTTPVCSAVCSMFRPRWGMLRQCRSMSFWGVELWEISWESVLERSAPRSTSRFPFHSGAKKHSDLKEHISSMEALEVEHRWT